MLCYYLTTLSSIAERQASLPATCTLVSAAALGGDAEQHDEGEDAEDPVHEQQDKEAFFLRLVHSHRVNHLRPPKQRGLSAEDPTATHAMLVCSMESIKSRSATD